MNTTLSSLSLSLVLSQSPFISSVGYLHCSNINLMKFSSHFVFGESFLIERSSFGFFLNHVSHTEFNTHQSLSSNTTIEFEECYFTNCQDPSVGGAIYCRNSQCISTVTKCIFLNCSCYSTVAGYPEGSERSGGAIFLVVKTMYIKNCVFEECMGNAGLALSVGFPVGKTGYVNCTLALRCRGPKDNSATSIIIDTGTHVFSSSNATQMYAPSATSMSMHSGYSPTATIKFYTIDSISSVRGLSISSSSSGVDVDYLLISNATLNSIFGLYSGSYRFSNSYVSNTTYTKWVYYYSSTPTHEFTNCFSDVGFNHFSKGPAINERETVCYWDKSRQFTHFSDQSSQFIVLCLLLMFLN